MRLKTPIAPLSNYLVVDDKKNSTDRANSVSYAVFNALQLCYWWYLHVYM